MLAATRTSASVPLTFDERREGPVVWLPEKEGGGKA